MCFAKPVWHTVRVMDLKPKPSLLCGPTQPSKKPFWRRFAVLGWAGTGLVMGVLATPLAATHTSAGDKHSDPEEIEISESRSIEFGTVAGSADGPGTIVLSPSGALSTTGYGVVIKGHGRAGKYKIEGPSRAYVLITLPSSATLSSGSSHATLNNFTASPSGVARLDKHGRLTVEVGATLNLPAGQLGGEYTGTFPIFVDLQ